MNKFFLYGAAMVAMITSACSGDAPDAPAATDGFVTITASMPAGLNTRSIADGTNADRLQYAVYDVDGAVVFSSAQADAPQATYNNDLTFTLALPLVKGQTYDMVFWADKAGNSYYTFDAATGDISVDYANLKGNDNDRDAFFTLKEDLTVTGAMNVAVELYRPFGQLNIGTADVAAAKRAGIDYGNATVTVKEVYGKLNLISGVASEPADVTFPAATALTEAFPNVGDGKTYTYLSMNYILTGSVVDANVNAAQKEVKDVNIAFADVNGKAINTFDLAAVPFQRNYRTNIFGNLLTSTVDFNIVIKPGFEEPDHNMEVVEVKSAAEFKAAIAAGGTVKVPASAKIELTEKLEFNAPTNLIIEGELVSDGPFRQQVNADLTVSGKGNITVTDNEDDTYGLFDVNNGAKLTVENVTIESPARKNGTPISLNNGDVVMEGVTMDCGSGCVRARNNATGTFYAKNCTFYGRSNSNAAYAGNNWTYALNFDAPVEAVLENCKVVAIQGGIAAVSGAKVTILSGDYTTDMQGDTKGSSFYPVFVSTYGTVTIKGGNFSTCDGKAVVYNSDNDVNAPLGYLFLEGGNYANQGYYQGANGIVEPAEGYQWTATGNADFPWTVTKK